MLFSKTSAIAMACAISAGMAQDSSPKPRVHVPQTVYDTMDRYTAFVAASAQETCPKPPYNSSIYLSIDNKITDTQATIFQDDTAKEFILAVPGTKSLVDVLTDVNIELVPYTSDGVACPGDCKVHNGFLTAWNSISPAVTSALSNVLAVHPSYTVSVVGYSLGASIAALAHATISELGFPLTRAYTLGQPRTGNQAYADFVDGLIARASDDESNLGGLWRITHANDPVPQLIPQGLGYRHSRTEYWQMNDAQGMTGPGLTYRCFGQEAADCSDMYAQGGTDPIAHGFYTNRDLNSNYSCVGFP